MEGCFRNGRTEIGGRVCKRVYMNPLWLRDREHLLREADAQVGPRSSGMWIRTDALLLEEDLE